MSKNKTSRRQAQRFATQVASEQASIPELPAALQSMLDDYVLAGVDAELWSTSEVRVMLAEVMRRAHIVGPASFRKHLGVVAKYLWYRHEQSLSLAITQAFSAIEVDSYYLHGLTGSDRTRNDYRSRLVNIAVRINPTAGAPVKAPTLGHRAVRPGYTRTQEAAIRRTALRQRNPGTRRALCAVVGFCAGAGLDPADLRNLRTDTVTDHAAQGIEVTVAVGKIRTVWVRREYEKLVRVGLEGLRPGALVIGKQVDRRNVTTSIIECAELYDAPPLDASRLRSTWLTWLMTRQVPVQVILYASGLKTARTLTDLIDQLPRVDPAESASELRGEQS